MRILFLFVLAASLVSLNTSAQDHSPSIFEKNERNDKYGIGYKVPPPPADPIPTNVPFDGGLGLLLVAGALYGKRVIDKNKKAA